MQFVVPGRLCITGEHSDWAASFISSNENIIPGKAVLICTKEMAITTKASLLTDKRLKINHNQLNSVLDVELEDSALLKEAKSGSFWSYAAGVAWVLVNRYKITTGISIDLSSTLPMCKGLSSSAAICVTVARVFNMLFHLSLSPQGEMEIAYSGERVSGSLCGPMDQAVAFGPGAAVVLDFDVGIVKSTALTLPTTDVIYIVYADLNGSKDTKKILRDLQKAYPFPQNAQHELLIKALGELNRDICTSVCEAIEKGDSEALGKLLTKAQAIFDEAAMPLCDNLKSEKLHKVLSDPTVKEFVYGGKGVGSQGDGSIQFVAKSEEAANKLVEYLNSTGGCRDATILTVGEKIVENTQLNAKHKSESTKITRAIIPTGGLGTRLFPASIVIRPKAMVPILDPYDGRVKPLLLFLIEECLVRSLIDEVIIVVDPGDEKNVKNLLTPSTMLLDKLSSHNRIYGFSIVKLLEKVKFVIQPTPEGFGHGVQIATNHLHDNEPFIVLLSYVVLHNHLESSVLSSVIHSFHHHLGEYSIIGLTKVPRGEAYQFGCVNGNTVNPIDGNPLIAIDIIIEKPNDEQLEKLHPSEEICESDHFLAVLGPYAFTSEICKLLKEAVEKDHRHNNEIQLTPCISTLVEDRKVLGIILPTPSLDTGVPLSYSKTMATLLTSFNRTSSS